MPVGPTFAVVPKLRERVVPPAFLDLHLTNTAVSAAVGPTQGDRPALLLTAVHLTLAQRPAAAEFAHFVVRTDHALAAACGRAECGILESKRKEEGGRRRLTVATGLCAVVGASVSRPHLEPVVVVALREEALALAALHSRHSLAHGKLTLAVELPQPKARARCEGEGLEVTSPGEKS